jgi:hypothetical protein
MAGRNRLACFGAREKGTCDNRLTIRRDEVEARVLKVLEEKLLRQDLFDEFCEEFTREMNRLRMEHRASLSTAAREIERLDARRKKLIEMVREGAALSVVKDELNGMLQGGNSWRRSSLPPRSGRHSRIRRWPESTERRSESWLRPSRSARAALRLRRPCRGSWTPSCSRPTPLAACSRLS